MIPKKHLIDWWIGTRKLYLHTVFVSSNISHKIIFITKKSEFYGKDDREPLSIICSSIWNLSQHFAKSLFCQIQFQSISSYFSRWSVVDHFGRFYMAYFATNSVRLRDSPLYVNKWCIASFVMNKCRRINRSIGLLRHKERQDMKCCSRR